jgi:hypothetical protein
MSPVELEPSRFDHMFDSLVMAATAARAAGAVGAWARVENAACAHRLSAVADVLEARLSADGSEEREQWCMDNWDAVAAEVSAAQNVSLGVASHQLALALALRERLPRVAEAFAAGQLTYRLVNAIVYRTGLIRDPAAAAKVDNEIADAATDWGSLSVAKLEAAIDYWVDRYDPHALRRVENSARGRHVGIAADRNGSGLSWIEGSLFSHDAAALDKRLDAMARAVCDEDPRNLELRRADALGALAQGADRLACQCARPTCAVADGTPGAVVVNVIAEEKSLCDDASVNLDGAPEPNSGTPRPVDGASTANPAVIMGGGIIPAPLLAAKLAGTATIRLVRHPGDSPPESRYVPSAALARFVRCRDLTCRFPGCDEPADHCDIDHTIPYPAGPTQAANLKCLCRKHHLLKTFWAWLDRQLPDGTVNWTSPGGQTYTTQPGSRLLFPTLCRPTAPVHASVNVSSAEASRGLKMPRRRTTRVQDRAQRIEAERKLNDDYVAERNKPPPF